MPELVEARMEIGADDDECGDHNNPDGRSSQEPEPKIEGEWAVPTRNKKQSKHLHLALSLSFSLPYLPRSLSLRHHPLVHSASSMKTSRVLDAVVLISPLWPGSCLVTTLFPSSLY
ncbi:hypothetical protein D9757_014795 [Collybiopsis confluens]|uniref:Uncharacterized protein n=1 Tax=Collybiopsis confluens TaxID=2823264 RepID=A0A8H5GDI8_9AGAR|nr:hypothetical protein D9757_014795 [Collybiopsis confluens]